jgi:hypothetical protein
MQCFSCDSVTINEKKRGYGTCRKNGSTHNLLEKNTCASYKLGTIEMVKKRTSGTVKFDAYGYVYLMK